jgi:hypothetical protein
MLRFPLFIVLLAIGLSACGPSDAQQQHLAEQVTVSEFQYARIPDGSRIVTGTLHNDSRERLDNVQLRVALYDADNRRISTVSVVVQDVAPESEKAFREPVPTDVDAEGARVQSILVL